MASSNVSKLRFMAKARDQTSADPNGASLKTDSSDRWSLSAIDPSRVCNSSEFEMRLSSINSMARRSYGGANPYIEQQMTIIEKAKKQKNK